MHLGYQQPRFNYHFTFYHILYFSSEKCALLVLIHNGRKLDIRHKKFMIHAVYIPLIFT
jgi:hypothetical protein